MAKGGMELIGDKELEKLFKSLGDRVQRRVTRQAINRAATPVVKAARRNAPKESGLLKKAMGKKVKTYPKKQTVVAIVGPRRKVSGEFKGKRRVPANYSHLVHNGFTDKHGNHHPGDPFLTKALDETQGEALDVLKENIAVGVVREAKKGAK